MRITFKALSEAVDEWNEAHGFKYGDVGFLEVNNNAENVWLSTHCRPNCGAVRDVPGSYGKGPRTAFTVLQYLKPGDN